MLTTMATDFFRQTHIHLGSSLIGFGLKGLTCPFLNQSLKLRRYVFHLDLGQVPLPFQVLGELSSLNYVG